VPRPAASSWSLVLPKRRSRCWYQAIAAQEDATRVCGWGATYAMLRAAQPGQGRLLRYQQSPEEGGSMVSIATGVWP